MQTIDASLVGELFKPFPDWLIDGQYGRAGAGPSELSRPVLAKRNETISCVLYRPFTDYQDWPEFDRRRHLLRTSSDTAPCVSAANVREYRKAGAHAKLIR
jgi:hypothetical protein